jgi:hypothetical protein
MTTAIPDLWPNDIKAEVLPPIAVLKVQEGLLARRTQGLLQAKLTTTATENLVQHQLDLIAPSLNFYRERLLSATHDRVMLYPVIVTAGVFGPKPETPKGLLGLTTPVVESIIQRMSDLGLTQRRAATDEEFVQLVREVLQSEEVRALIHSLIARISQDRGERLGNGAVGQERCAEVPKEGN